MLYALVCRDKPNSLELRMANRDAHLAYMAEQGLATYGGPMLDDDGNMCGSLIVIDVEDKAAAEVFSANDPYSKAGLFESVKINAIKKVLG